MSVSGNMTSLDELGRSVNEHAVVPLTGRRRRAARKQGLLLLDEGLDSVLGEVLCEVGETSEEEEDLWRVLFMISLVTVAVVSVLFLVMLVAAGVASPFDLPEGMLRR